MPLYEYKCRTCNIVSERTISLENADKDLQFCENCAGTLQRIISGNLAIKFVGSGFYKVDSKKNE